MVINLNKNYLKFDGKELQNLPFDGARGSFIPSLNLNGFKDYLSLMYNIGIVTDSRVYYIHTFDNNNNLIYVIHFEIRESDEISDESIKLLYERVIRNHFGDVCENIISYIDILDEPKGGRGFIV